MNENLFNAKIFILNSTT